MIEDFTLIFHCLKKLIKPTKHKLINSNLYKKNAYIK
jgi:hypothetical protein